MPPLEPLLFSEPLIDAALLPAAALCLGTAASIFGAMLERSNIACNEVGFGMKGRMTGIPAGTAVLLKITDRGVFSLVFGRLIPIAVALSAIGWNMRLKASNLVGMGVISGFMGVITSVGAPPLSSYSVERCHRRHSTSPVMRDGTICGWHCPCCPHHWQAHGPGA